MACPSPDPPLSLARVRAALSTSPTPSPASWELELVGGYPFFGGDAGGGMGGRRLSWFLDRWIPPRLANHYDSALSPVGNAGSSCYPIRLDRPAYLTYFLLRLFRPGPKFASCLPSIYLTLPISWCLHLSQLIRDGGYSTSPYRTKV